MKLKGFSPAEKAMIQKSCEALLSVGYSMELLKVLIRADLPAGYRGMSWKNGAILGAEAFVSQALLNHVLEEELLHLQQKASGMAESFGPGTAQRLEEAVDAVRKFTLPDS